MKANNWTAADRIPLQFHSLQMSTGLLMSRYRPWTITILMAGLESLDLSMLKMSPRHWRQFLRQLNISSLLNFTVSGDAPITSIASFLAHHTRIHQLSISQTETKQTPHFTSLLVLYLPDLIKLSGPPHIVKLLLMCASPTTRLRYLNFFLDPEGLAFESVNNILERPACDWLERLSFRLPCDATSSVLAFDHKEVNFKAILDQI